MQSPHATSSTTSNTSTKSIADIERIARDSASGTMSSLEDFAKYWTEFDSVARNLVEARVLSKAERDLYFWTGLPRATRKSIGQQLAAADLSFTERQIPTWRDVIQAGRLVFQDATHSPPQDRDLDKLVRTLHNLNVDDTNYAVAYARLLVAAPAVADRIPSPSKWTRAHSHKIVLPSSAYSSVVPSNGGNAIYRPTLRRVQSFISYQHCPGCSDHQHVLHRHT